MPSRPGRVRGLVAEWLVGMAALLRFVRGSPERHGAAVVVSSSPLSIGTLLTSRLCTVADDNPLAVAYRSLMARLSSSTSASTTAPA
ncbi:hypothetical protein EV714DRAFT_220954 [Schizophyllum commune]